MRLGAEDGGRETRPFRADPRRPQPSLIDRPHGVGHLATEAAACLGQHDPEQAGKDAKIAGAVGVGEGRALRRGRASVIEPALMARHRRLDLTQRGSAPQLGEKQGAEMLARGEAARALVGETVRGWVLKLAPLFARELRRRLHGQRRGGISRRWP